MRLFSRPRHLYLFCHVPKTAGTTLASALQRLGRQAIRLTFECRFKDEVTRRAIDEIAHRRLTPAAVRAFYGHRVYYGLHELSPRPARYFTFLRDPVERVVSHYRFHCTIARNPEHPRHELMRQRLLVRGEFIPAAEWFHGHYAKNLMVRWLAYAMHERETHVCRPMGSSDLEQALRFLNHCWFVGLTERSDEDMPHVCRAMGVRVPRERKNPSQHAIHATDRETLETLVVEHEALDQELYRYAIRQREACLSRLAEVAPGQLP